MTCTHHCQLRYGLFCADGRRGAFAQGDGDTCTLCGVLGWQHSTLPRCGEPEIAPVVADVGSYTGGRPVLGPSIENSAEPRFSGKTNTPGVSR